MKKIIGGQDGLKEIDLSNNPAIEEVIINLSSDLRHVNLNNCKELRKIRLWGCLVPYVDLTQNNWLQHVEINYLNTFKGKSDEYGTGYPRPFIFVNEDFDTEVINEQDRQYEYYTYVLVFTREGTKEGKVLYKLKDMKPKILGIPTDFKRENIANFHYEIMDLLNKE